jgi:hypothetical protein
MFVPVVLLFVPMNVLTPVPTLALILVIIFAPTFVQVVPALVLAHAGSIVLVSAGIIAMADAQDLVWALAQVDV